MDITQIQAVKAAGTATTRVVSGDVVQHIPEDHAYIEVTTKKFDPYTGEEVAPEVTQFRKSSLLNELVGIDNQIANLNARKDAINALLAEFPTEEKAVLKEV
jgi:hypothetical protein